MTRVSVLDDVTIILPDFRIWSGGARMDDNDYVGIRDDELPPEVAASRGAKKLINPDVLRPLARYRGKAERTCASVGVKFLNGWAVPNGDVRGTIKRIETIFTDFDRDLAKFFDDYEGLVDQWVRHLAQDRPDFAAKINEARIPRGRIEMRFGRDLSVFQVSGSAQDHADTMSGARGSLRDQVLSSVWTEFAMVAEKLRFVPEGYFKVSIRAKFRRISDRLSRFGFCDETGMFRRLADLLGPFQSGQGTIVEDEYQALRRLFSDVVDARSLEDAVTTAGSRVPLLPAHSAGLLDLPAPVEPSPEAAPVLDLPAPVEPSPEAAPALDLPAPVEPSPEVAAALDLPAPAEPSPGAAPALDLPAPVEPSPEVAAALDLPAPAEPSPEVAPALDLPAPVEPSSEAAPAPDLPAPVKASPEVTSVPRYSPPVSHAVTSPPGSVPPPRRRVVSSLNW
jgi:hypothetical protein